MRSQREIKARLVAIGKQKEPIHRVTLKRMLHHAKLGPDWRNRQLSHGEQDRLDRALTQLDDGSLRGHVDASRGCWIKTPPQSRMRPKPPVAPRLSVDWASSRLKWR